MTSPEKDGNVLAPNQGSKVKKDNSKQRALLITQAVSTMALIARLSIDGLTREEVTKIVQALYTLASDIQEHYKDN